MDNDISKKLQEYDEAFDFYMDRGRMPDALPQGDILGGLMIQAIQDNHQLQSQDPLWQELLKEELLKFIEALLKLFVPIDGNRQHEKELIKRFSNGDKPKKRQMWKEVYQTIKGRYGAKEVNIDGYVEQMKTNNPDDVLSSMIKDWDRACDERTDSRKRELIDQYKDQWEREVKEHGLSDFRQRKKIEKIVYSYPALAEIVRIMGREQPKREDEMDDTVRKYLPILPSPPKPAVEIDEVSDGNSLLHMMPVETAILAHQQTEDLFYLKYATHKLQLFANKTKEESQIKAVQEKKKKPRLEKGPIIVNVDTSGSMMGKPIQLAKCLLLQLLRMAKKQKRKCFLITFSVRAKHLDLSRPGSWGRLNDFLDDTFSGGTDGEEMLRTSLEMLQSKNFAMADVLIISDFCFDQPIMSTMKMMQEAHEKGTRFYGLKINSVSLRYNQILNRIWTVQTK